MSDCMQAVREYTDALRKRRQERRSVLSSVTGAPPGDETGDVIERHERLIAREKDMQVERKTIATKVLKRFLRGCVIRCGDEFTQPTGKTLLPSDYGVD